MLTPYTCDHPQLLWHLKNKASFWCLAPLLNRLSRQMRCFFKNKVSHWEHKYEFSRQALGSSFLKSWFHLPALGLDCGSKCMRKASLQPTLFAFSFCSFNHFKSLTKKVKCISDLGAKCHCLVCA